MLSLKITQKIKEIKKLDLDKEMLSKILNIFEGIDE